MKRGSHTAALKAFTRATELNPDSLYSFYQLACIEQIVGEYVAAVKAYKAVLERKADYVPALFGVGETLLLLARRANQQFVHGRALGHCQQAAEYLTRSAVLHSDISCVWKLLGDVFTLVHVMPKDIVRLSVSSTLLRSGQEEETQEELGKTDLLALASRCYATAIKQQPNNSSLWQDLGLSYWREGHASVLHNCIQCLLTAVSLNPNNHQHWLALGTVVAQKQVNNKALAQHCYIKSIQLEPNNVSAWTNLGVLYLTEGNVCQANEAFRQAQAIAPDSVRCWLGQAMLAETITQDVEAMDLFRHATQLDNHVEGSIGFGQWVVNILQDPATLADDWNKYVIHEMAAVLAASDALDKYTERMPDDPVAYNLWGLLLERQGLHSQACQAFAAALELLDRPNADPKHKEQVTANYAINLRDCKMYEEAVQQYKKLTNPRQEDGYGLALTYFMQKDYAMAQSKYESLLPTAKEADLSAIHTALGMIAYCMGDMDSARTNLFSSSQCSSPCRQGLLALCALGLLQGNTTLTTAVLNELQPSKPETPKTEKQNTNKETIVDATGKGTIKDGKAAPQVDEDVAYLSALNRLAQGDISGARDELQQGGRVLWEQLISCLVTHCPQDIQDMMRDIPMEAKQGVGMAVWGLAKGYHRCTTNGSHRNCFREALKAAHANPESLSAWLCMLACGHAELVIRGSMRESCMQLAETLLPICTHIMARVESELHVAAEVSCYHQAWLQTVHVWCVRHYVIALLHTERPQQAEHFLQHAVQLYESDTSLQSLLALIKQCTTTLNNLKSEDAHIWAMLVDLYAKQGLNQEAVKTLNDWIRVPNQRASALAKKLHWCATHKEGRDEKYQAVAS